MAGVISSRAFGTRGNGTLSIDGTMKKVWIVALWIAFDAVPLYAQQEIGVWAAVSTGTPRLIGTTAKVSLRLDAVRYSRVILQRSGLTLRYTLDFIPYARMSALSQTVTGRGAAPIGFEVRFRQDRRVQPSGMLSGGIINFNHVFPQPGGAQFNFIADFGVGVHVGHGRSFGMDAGYRYHHLSNGNRVPRNPGFDSNLLVVGIQFKK
jgi:hypothetical protein